MRISSSSWQHVTVFSVLCCTSKPTQQNQSNSITTKQTTATKTNSENKQNRQTSKQATHVFLVFKFRHFWTKTQLKKGEARSSTELLCSRLHAVDSTDTTLPTAMCPKVTTCSQAQCPQSLNLPKPYLHLPGYLTPSNSSITCKCVITMINKADNI